MQAVRARCRFALLQPSCCPFTTIVPKPNARFNNKLAASSGFQNDACARLSIARKPHRVRHHTNAIQPQRMESPVVMEPPQLLFEDIHHPSSVSGNGAPIERSLQDFTATKKPLT